MTGAAPISIRLDLPSATVTTGGDGDVQRHRARPLGNEFPVGATWTLAPGTLGTVTPGPARPSRSPRAASRATVSSPRRSPAPNGTLTASAAITVTPPPPIRVAAVRYGVANRRLHVYVTVVDAGGRRVNDVAVTVALYREGKVYARAAGSTVRGPS